jgi:hypothetical protein
MIANNALNVLVNASFRLTIFVRYSDLEKHVGQKQLPDIFSLQY